MQIPKVSGAARKQIKKMSYCDGQLVHYLGWWRQAVKLEEAVTLQSNSVPNEVPQPHAMLQIEEH